MGSTVVAELAMPRLVAAFGHRTVLAGGLVLLGGPALVLPFAANGYGADLIYWERPAGGRVFNAGATNYTGALAVDPGLQALKRNVLHHMGIVRADTPRDL